MDIDIYHLRLSQQVCDVSDYALGKIGACVGSHRLREPSRLITAKCQVVNNFIHQTSSRNSKQ